MRHTDAHKAKHISIRQIAVALVLLTGCLLPAAGWAQSGDATVDALTEMGFENVAWTEDDEERVYVLQNSAYRLMGVGIGKAVDVIQEKGLPDRKPCRIIVLDNNVPQISLRYEPVTDDSLAVATRNSWDVSYDLGDSWKKIRKVERKNSSLFKVDILVYPKLYFKNVVITQVYQVCLELSPAVEVSLWKGSKLSLQMIVPVYTDGYAEPNGNFRPGYLTLEQNVRLPHNIWLRGVVGVFNRRTYGVEVSAYHPFKNEHFSVEGKFGLVGVGYFNSFSKFLYNGETRWYWSVGGDYYWSRFNTQIKARMEQYLLKDIGARLEVIRHFRYASVGFYGLVSDKASSNGGFKISIALPPYRYKRRGYIPRISTSQVFGITYNAGNQAKYYLMPTSTADDSNNMMKMNQYNPYFIKSELSN